MFWESLEILLTPRLIVVQRAQSKRAGSGGLPARSELMGEAETGGDWRAAVAALGKMLAADGRRGTRVQIALSDLWVRSHLMPVAASGLREDEMLTLARAQFSRQYPEAAPEQWMFRLALQEGRLLSTAIESELREALRAAHSNAGVRLSGAEPLFTWVYDRFGTALADANGWMLLDEPGMLTLAFLERGRLVSLHSQRCAAAEEEVAARLLERQSALIAQNSPEVRVFSVGTRAIRLPSPWRIVLHQKIFDSDDHQAAAPLQALVSSQH